MRGPDRFVLPIRFGGQYFISMKMLTYGLAFLLPLGIAQAQVPDWGQVSDIFEERCVFCHSGEFAPLGLQLDRHGGVMAGSENGPVVTPGTVETSPLYQRIMGQAEPRMPLDGPPFLSEAEIATIAAWIDGGAMGPGGEEPQAAAPPDPREDGQILYGEVSRILGQKCIKCHSDNGLLEGPPEDLRLDSYAAILAGGDRTVVIPGNAQASELFRRIEGLASPRMPFDGPPWLDEDAIALLKDWIDGGALSDEAVPALVPVGGSVRLRGVMTGPNEIDGAAFVVTDQTRVDDRPSVGQQAEVRARIAADGGLVAERLRAR
jgi:Planctomycete cytochrome C